jgi:methylaspartate mutase epsilon subunit
MGETLHLVQDAAAVAACRELAQEYLHQRGFDDVFTPVTLLHWMGAWPQDEAQCAALVAYGGTLAAIAGAASVTTKSVHEAFGIPTPQANAEGLRTTRMAVYLARDIRLDGLREFQDEKALIKREARALIDKALEMGDGDAAVGTVRGFEAGVLDVPWSPSRYCKSRIMPARDIDGYLRIVDPGLMPYPKDVMEIHAEKLRLRAERDGLPYGHELAVASVYEMAEPVAKLLPDTIGRA